MARAIVLVIAKLGLLGSFAFWATDLHAAERYFVIVFGSQSTPKHPNYTHTWATVVKTPHEAANEPAKGLEFHTISWLPSTLKVHTLKLFPEHGTNFDLETTINTAVATRQRISYWGPFEIQQEIYQRFLAQKARLESGVVRYQAIDSIYGPENRTVSDCIHAVSDTDYRHNRYYYLELRHFGEEASELIVWGLAKRDRINPYHIHEWVAESMSLQRFPLIRRDFCPRPWWQ